MTRALPGALAAMLGGGVTTIARAWSLTRRDGLRLGFTDHDHPLVFDGLVFEAASGFSASTVEQATGLAIDTHTVRGALQSTAISDLDVERGLFDGAKIVFWLVDWTDPESRLMLSRGRIGEVRRGERAFEAEVVGLSEALNQPRGRAYLTTCDRRLGDAGCRVELSDGAYLGVGQVAARIAAGSVTVTGLDGFDSRWFDRGALTWTSGANAGSSARVKAHRRIAGSVTLALWQEPPAEIAGGDAFEVTAGCDKTAGTCATKFANILNFGGFPHMPGDDWATAYPNSGEAHDGGSLFGS